MRRNSKVVRVNNTHDNSSQKIDDVDIKVIELLTFGRSSKQISTKLGIPLSTVQRRSRKLMERGLIISKVEPNYEMLGFKRGLIHVYLSKAHIDTVVQKVSKMRGIISASVHVGNSDVVGFFIYKTTQQLLKMNTDVKQIPGVDKVMWSEEVYSVPVNKEEESNTSLFLD